MNESARFIQHFNFEDDRPDRGSSSFEIAIRSQTSGFQAYSQSRK